MAISPLKAGTSVIGKLFGNAVSSAVGFGAGVAMAPVMGPVVRDISNSVNSHYSFVFPEPGVLANGVAQGQVRRDDAGRWASYHGVGDKAFQALVDIANTGPGVPVAFDLWRRAEIDEAGFRRAAKRVGLEQEWIEALVRIKRVLLTPAELANAVVQGHRDFDAAATDAELQGIGRADFQTMVDDTGLPPGPETMQRAANRHLATFEQFADAIREGHTKTKYIDQLWAMREAVLPALNYVEGHLRDWISEQEMLAGGELTGHTPEQMDLLFKIHGRPISFHQTWIGLQRGGSLDGPIGDIHPAFLASLRRSNIQPPFYNLAWAQRYTYPAAFVLRALVQSGDLTAAEGEQILLYEGWEPTLAKKVAAKWAQGSSAAAKEATAADLLTLYDGRHATRADTLAALEALGYPADEAATKLDVIDARRVVGAKQQAIGDLHTAFKKGDLSVAHTTAALEALGVAAWAVPDIIAAWRTYLTAHGIQPAV